jgi:hypothetical protein
MKRLLLGLFSLVISTLCYGIGSTGGPAVPAFVTYLNTGIARVWVPLSTRAGTVPACASFVSGSLYPLSFSITTDAGKAMLAGIIAAHEAGEQMSLNGTGTCDVESNVETLFMAETAT